MECTQRLECTQDLYETHSQRTCPEEIGFLGICGKKYPVKKGPNKIGRDPQACNIELNLNSISRQHAVINVINSTNFMIMDLDSANKTKLGGQILQPYIPHPLRDGDTLQFGDVFGIFRLLEKDDELPMTQALDIPDTPMTNHYISRMNKVPITLVPESPDCSDMEDSYVVPSQDGDKSDTNFHFIKPGKTIAIQPIGSKKIDNIYWNASKKSKSLSLSLNSSKVSLNTSDPTVINRLSCDDVSIHEMETQDPKLCKIERLPSKNEATEKIMKENPSIYSQPTQIHPNMPDVQKVSMQHEMQINLYASNKENIDNLHEAETQLYQMEPPKIPGTPTKRISEGAKNASSDKIEERHLSDEEIVFDEVDSQSFYEPFESQSIIPEDIIPNIEDNPVVEKKQEEKPADKRASRVKSGDSTDCEDIEMALTQIVSERPKVSDDDLTDCEDVNNDLTKKTADKNKDKLLDIEDLQTQVIEIDEPIKKGEHLNPPVEENFEDLPTQILVEDTIEKPEVVEKPVEDISFEDLPTQTITIESPMKQTHRQSADQDYSEEIVGPFKRPLLVAMKNKRKEVPMIQKEVVVIEDDNFYQSTQAIFEDLCSQEPYIGRNNVENKSDEREKPLNSVINRVIGCNLPHNEKSQNVNKKKSSPDSSEIKSNKLVSTSSKQKELPVDKLRRTLSDSSDVDSTPRKGKALKFSDNDLPNSQEIKKSVNMNQKCVVDVDSSDSETENNSLDDKKTPLLYHKKKKSKIDAKLDLTKRFEPDALPTRVITRVRKPTEYASKSSASILKPKFIPEQEDGIDKEIITENISRLKAKNEKSKTKSDNLKSDNRETKTLEKSKEEEKSSAKSSRAETSKIRNSKEDKKSTPKTNGTDSSKTLKKSDTSVDSKISTRRTRSQNKDTNNTNVKNQSPETAKPKDKMKSNTSLKPHEAGQSNMNLNSTEGANQSSRTTRSRKGQTKSLSPEIKPKRSYRRRTKKTPDKEIDQSKDTVKRTRRGKNAEVKENNPETIKPKSILKPSSYDQSVVYNKSSESMGSPSGVKRPANNDMMVPSPKRTRSTTEPIGSMRPSKIHYVLFTGLAAPEIEAKLNKLGAVTVTDVSKCTVVLTSEIRRTFKLLCAVGLGRPVVGSAWVQACVDTHTIVDPWKYLIKDEKVERRFRFDLRRTLLGKRNYLKGFTVSTTPRVLPPEQEMKQIVKCSGGIWGEGGPRWLVLSTPRDATMWPDLMRRGARIVSTEFVLEGVLRQIPDVDSYLLR